MTSIKEISKRWGGLSRLALLGVLCLLLIVFSVLRPDTFATWGNIRGILSTEVTIAFLAFGATLPLIVHEFDLSVAAVFTFAQVLTVGLVLQSEWSVPLAFAVTFAATILIGLVNGIAVTKFKVSSLITTLAVGSIVTGATLAYSGGNSILGNAPSALTSIARGSLAGVPLPVIYLAVATALLTLFFTRYPIGRKMYAIGANQEAAKRSGIATTRYVLFAFVGASCLAGIGGMLMGSRLGAATPDSGAALLIPAFSAALLGGTAFLQGRYNIPGTLVGVYVIAVAVTGLQQMGVALWVEPVFQGAVLLLAVGVAGWTARLRSQRAKKARLAELEHRAERLEQAKAGAISA